VADPQRAAAVANALKPSGLVPRGWLMPERGAAPLLTSGKPAGAICLVGHAGGGFWPVFAGWRQKNPEIADPLDAWSKMVIEPVARMAGGQAVFPSDRPWHPFQAWATEAEGLRRSALGMLIHPVYGLWHGYRGAILFEDVALDDLNPGDLAARPRLTRATCAPTSRASEAVRPGLSHRMDLPSMPVAPTWDQMPACKGAWIPAAWLATPVPSGPNTVTRPTRSGFTWWRFSRTDFNRSMPP
jgi:hypothetical protein